jgi:hypothetical protein
MELKPSNGGCTAAVLAGGVGKTPEISEVLHLTLLFRKYLTIYKQNN